MEQPGKRVWKDDVNYLSCPIEVLPTVMLGHPIVIDKEIKDHECMLDYPDDYEGDIELLADKIKPVLSKSKAFGVIPNL